MTKNPRDQFAEVLARIVSSAVKTAVEYDDGNHVLRPAVQLVQAIIDGDGYSAYTMDLEGRDLVLNIAPCDDGAFDPMFVSKPVKLSDVIANQADTSDDPDAFWVALDAAVASAKKKVAR
jgi:hypothetical protein